MRDADTEKYDIVIIGAGLGGLAAALQLSIKGKKVLLLEQKNAPGGLATSLVRGRFEFEATLHGMQGIGPKENPKITRRFLEESGVQVEFVPIPEAYRLILPNEHIDIVIPYGTKNMIDAVEKEAPGSKEGLTSLMKLCNEIHDSVNYFGSYNEKKEIKKWDTFTKGRAFFQTSGYTAEEVIKTFNISDKALHIIYPYWLHLGVPMNRVSFTAWAYMIADYFSGGSAVIKDNSYGLSLAMDRRIRELGSKTEYNTYVDKILVENGSVKGLVTSKGKVIETNYIISSAYPNKVYGSMIFPKEAVPKEAFKLNNARLMGCSAFCVYLGLDVPPDILNINNYSYFIGHTIDLNVMYENCKTLDAPKYYTASCLNKIIPDCTPNGTTQITISALQKGEAWESIRPENYSMVKREIANSMIKSFGEVLGVNLFDHIEEIEMATPVTIARYTDSWNGSIYGYEQRVWDSHAARMSSEQDEKYIRGLEFAGAHASSGNGYDYCIKSGRKAADNILKLIKDGGNENEG